jgi:predicted DNA-binding protein with PD1-like motif
MTSIKNVTFCDGFMGRLAHGCDLLAELVTIAKKNDITLGRIEAIGAVQKACVGFYDQSSHQYGFHTFDRPMEIINLAGNVSMKDDAPMVHAHITLGDEDGTLFGGHLGPGTLVFACEVMIQRIEGDAYVRGFDEETGLPLWQL